MFQGRKLVIATKHAKEKVIGPLLERELGVFCFVSENFDTDSLGTFTGEVERKLDPIATARQKCLTAMELNKVDLGIASEGSFGPHPKLFFVNADDEFLIFIDTKNNLEVIVREVSTKTNFNGKTLTTVAELLEFGAEVNFPSHGIILRGTKTESTNIIKGITDLIELKEAFHFLMRACGSVYAETDMRAMYNPSRMKVIEAATCALIEKILAVCPACNKPGFGVTSVKRGLKCSLCSLPTESILSYIYVCQHCEHLREVLYPQHKTSEDPMHCQYCNP